jgi:hypothetical protein
LSYEEKGEWVITRKTVLVSEIDLLDRTPVPGDDDKKLRADIKANGLKNPILVTLSQDGGYQLVDGLRRLNLIGTDSVEVIFSDDYREMFQILADVRDEWQRKHSPRRVWDLYFSTQELRRKHTAMFRYNSRQHLKQRGRLKENDTRHLLSRATGISTHYVQTIVSMYGKYYRVIAEQEQYLPFVKEAVEAIDAGENAYTWDRKLRQLRTHAARRITGAAEQRQVLTETLRTLNSAIRITNEVAEINVRITKDEALAWAGEYRAAKNALAAVYRKLMERVAK